MYWPCSIGVILADTTKVAEAIIETLQSARQNVLMGLQVKPARDRTADSATAEFGRDRIDTKDVDV